MSSTKCRTCQGDISGEAIKLPVGYFHKECFVCTVCGRNLVEVQGYLNFKGYYLCSMPCRKEATAHPEQLPTNLKKWGETTGNRSGWKRADGKDGIEIQSIRKEQERLAVGLVGIADEFKEKIQKPS